jgi:hypothetical protein
MVNYSSAHGYIATEEETAFGQLPGSPVWKFVDVVSEGLSGEAGWLYQPGVQRFITKARPGLFKWGGDINVVVEPENVCELFKFALGSVTTTQPDATGAPNTYEHKIVPADDLPSFGLEVARGKVTALRALGCKIAGFTLNGGAGKYLTATFNVLGKKPSAVTRQTPSFSTLAGFTGNDVAQVLIGGSDKKAQVQEWTLEYNNGIEDGEVAYGLGSESVVRLAEGGAELTFTGRLVFEDTDQLTAFLNNSEFALDIKYQGGVIEGSYNYYFRAYIPRLVYDTESANINEKELIIEELKATALYDTTAGTIIEVYFQNTQSSI